MKPFLMFVAVTVGGYALVAWTLWFFTDAGVAGAVSAGAVCWWGYLDQKDRRRMRAYREAVWERRQREGVPFWQLPPNVFDEHDKARWPRG